MVFFSFFSFIFKEVYITITTALILGPEHSGVKWHHETPSLYLEETFKAPAYSELFICKLFSLLLMYKQKKAMKSTYTEVKVKAAQIYPF